MYNILICDDEQDIVNALKIYLSGGDYCLFEASNGREALEVVEKNDIHLILMDIMMPQLDGIAATAKLREKSNVPIILLTAKSESSDKVLGLNIGADDYITKPFSVRELAARVKSLLRRVAPQQESEPQTLRSGDIMIDITNYEAFKGGEKLSLTLKEFELLKVLVLSRGKVLTRNFLLDRIWGYEYYGETRTVDVHIRHLRQKLGEEPYIETVRGVGYRFVDREQEA